MTRSSTTGLYTRVDNSFSNPVVGTTISPTDADTFFDDVETCMNSFIGTSTTSLAIGTGSKTFVTQLTKTFIPGTFIHAFSLADSGDFMFGTVTSYSSVNGNLVVDVTATGGSGTDADWVIMQAGARGATGATGSTGAIGPTSGVQFAYSTTTADADPGAGIFRLNNATVASATAGYFDNVDAGGATVSTWLDTFDDSTNTAKGTLVLRGITAPTAWAIFSVTGSVVDGTGYRKLTLTYVAGGGTFTDTNTFAANFIRAGDKGADGVGSGDVVGPASATDNGFARFDLTTGKLLKDSAATIAIADGGSGATTAGGARTAFGLTYQVVKPFPQGRITLTTALPVMVATVSAATTVYYTPYFGNVVPIYDGTDVVPTAFTELSQATTDNTKSPAAVVNSSVYDLFVWNDSGTIRCTRGPAWLNVTTRGYSLTMVQGILLNTSSITNGPAASRGTWVGTIASNGSAQVDFIFGSSAAGGGAAWFGVWNAYNRVLLSTAVNNSTASWTNATASYAALDAGGTGSGLNNRVTVIRGANEDGFDAQLFQAAAVTGSVSAYLGITLDGTGAPAFPGMIGQTNSTSVLTTPASWSGVPGLGQHFVQAVQYSSGATTTMYGGNQQGLYAVTRY